MAISPRWVGSSISTPKEHGPSPVGRQRHYGALELAGAGEQVNVNDIVEIEDVVNMETGGSEQHLKNNRPLLAQVCGRFFILVLLSIRSLRVGSVPLDDCLWACGLLLFAPRRDDSQALCF